jgi:hypothetical protein
MASRSEQWKDLCKELHAKQLEIWKLAKGALHRGVVAPGPLVEIERLERERQEIKKRMDTWLRQDHC